LDGEVGFADAPGGGTLFFADLPPFDAAAAPADEAAGRTATVPARILHLDDDPLVLAALARACGSAEVVVSVKSLADARAALATRKFDLAIVDLELGDGSGTDLLPDLRDGAGGSVPVIIYSARGANPEPTGQV